jgi:hypothetical protein
MNIEEHLRGNFDKKSNEALDNWIGNSQVRFDAFMPFFLHEESRICQRAAWTFGKVCAERPQLMMKWMPDILEALDQPIHDAIIRNIVRAFQEMDEFPENYEGMVFEKCFAYLTSPAHPIAVQVFSMTICRKIAMKYPDLKGELIAVIEDLMLNGSAGILSRGKKELNILRK